MGAEKCWIVFVRRDDATLAARLVLFAIAASFPISAVAEEGSDSKASQSLCQASSHNSGAPTKPLLLGLTLRMGATVCRLSTMNFPAIGCTYRSMALRLGLELLWGLASYRKLACFICNSSALAPPEQKPESHASIATFCKVSRATCLGKSSKCILKGVLWARVGA